MATLAVLFLLFDSLIKVLKLVPAVEGTVQLGYPESVVRTIGIIELLCLAVYLIPRTDGVSGRGDRHARSRGESAPDPYVVPDLCGAAGCREGCTGAMSGCGRWFLSGAPRVRWAARGRQEFAGHKVRSFQMAGGRSHCCRKSAPSCRILGLAALRPPRIFDHPSKSRITLFQYRLAAKADPVKSPSMAWIRLTASTAVGQLRLGAAYGRRGYRGGSTLSIPW
jgi:hypothetical protein